LSFKSTSSAYYCIQKIKSTFSKKITDVLLPVSEMKEKLTDYLVANPVAIYFGAILILIAGVLLKRYGARLLSGIIYFTLRKYAKNLHGKQFLALLRKPFEYLFMGIIFWIIYNFLKLSSGLRAMNADYKFGIYIISIFQFYILGCLTWIVLRIADFIGYVFKTRTRQFSRIDPQLVLFSKDLIKVAVVLVSFFILVKGVFHEDAAGVIAGLGIGGLAIALAAQETIANLLGSIIIFGDKPFMVGDLVETSELKGVVEHVGFRSTRIRTMDKTLLTVPNKKLVDNALNNISRAEIRRVKFVICLTYDTTADQIRAIIKGISQALSENPMIETNYLVTFAEMQNNYLGIDVVYFGITDDLSQLALIKQEINFRVIDIVHESGARFVAQNPSLVFADNYKKKA
jgi:MscS family membrane protein